ncbi:hypothetical protein LLE49_19940 [Alicyclobacillus tolerans]|uniref:hypothetical protein n=1 Tax=Alicyclobacillus tolerans TaxID=90970 RepID=UPI001F1E1A23|nr:hypothetical protein [Alicyclobacillus tolerans]MCF8566995.1 hypothetical protein [Alicyclobacillus tolerans]
MAKSKKPKRKGLTWNKNTNVKQIAEQEQWEHQFSLAVLSEMRNYKGSYSEAYREVRKRYGTMKNFRAPSAEKVRATLAPALTMGYAKNKKGRGVSRLVAKHEDSLLRRTTVVDANGNATEVLIRGSRDASKMGKYWAAVKAYVYNGDESQLSEYIGKSIRTADGQVIPFETDLSLLDYLWNSGEFSDIVVSG